VVAGGDERQELLPDLASYGALQETRKRYVFGEGRMPKNMGKSWENYGTYGKISGKSWKPMASS
jgi:hypothetical protein